MEDETVFHPGESVGHTAFRERSLKRSLVNVQILLELLRGHRKGYAVAIKCVYVLNLATRSRVPMVARSHSSQKRIHCSPT